VEAHHFSQGVNRRALSFYAFDCETLNYHTFPRRRLTEQLFFHLRFFLKFELIPPRLRAIAAAAATHRPHP